MGFFLTQLDFIFFFYGLAFILLGATCVALARSSGCLGSWIVLGLFGFLHGANEWLDLTALVVGDSLPFAALRVAILTGSFVLLMEYARREGVRLGMAMPGLWIYLPFLAAIAAAGVLGGVDKVGVASRYGVGFFGALATALVFARLASGFSGGRRRLAITAAIGFALYAIAAGAVVPESAFWPASVVNSERFASVTGVPIQLLRGLLACWISLSLWALWGQQLIIEVSSTRYTEFLRRQFVWTLTLMATILIAGWIFTEFLGGIYRQNLQHEAHGEIDLLASRLAGETATVEAMVRALAGSPAVLSLLTGGNGADAERGRSVLDLDVEASGAEAGFILDTRGTVVASAGGDGGAASDAASQSSAGYFQRAIGGAAGYEFAYAAASGGPLYTTSFPIYAADGAVAGVAVLRKSLDAFTADLREFDQPYFFVDPDGVVVLTNRPELQHRMLWPSPAGGSPALATLFGTQHDLPLLKHDAIDSSWISINGDRDYLRRRYAGHSQWSLVLLTPSREIYASRVLGIVVTLLVALMTLIYLFGKERWVHDNVQMEKRLQLQQLAQQLRSQATTDPLTGLFNRLKFDQALAVEMARAERYKAPLSLALYDVDGFKKVNDTFGHQAGDKVLAQLAALVASNCRSSDTIARWGGEEFAIMLPGSDERMAQQVMEKLRAAIEEADFAAVGRVTCSFGVTQFADGDTPEVLLARADDALYRAKVNGRNRVEVTPPPGEGASGLASVA